MNLIEVVMDIQTEQTAYRSFFSRLYSARWWRSVSCWSVSTRTPRSWRTTWIGENESFATSWAATCRRRAWPTTSTSSRWSRPSSLNSANWRIRSNWARSSSSVWWTVCLQIRGHSAEKWQITFTKWYRVHISKSEQIWIRLWHCWHPDDANVFRMLMLSAEPLFEPRPTFGLHRYRSILCDYCDYKPRYSG